MARPLRLFLNTLTFISLVLTVASLYLWLSADAQSHTFSRTPLVENGELHGRWWYLAPEHGRLTLAACTHRRPTPNLSPANFPARHTSNLLGVIHSSGYAAIWGMNSDGSRRVINGDSYTSFDSIAIPFPYFVIAFAALPATDTLRRIRRRLLNRRLADYPHCTHCAYNLTANTTGTCPECGTPIPAR